MSCIRRSDDLTFRPARTTAFTTVVWRSARPQALSLRLRSASAAIEKDRQTDQIQNGRGGNNGKDTVKEKERREERGEGGEIRKRRE